MKSIFTLILVFCLYPFCHSQELELDFAHRYGIIEDDLEHFVNFVEYFDEFETWVVGGSFQSEIDVGINSSAILTSENEERLGFVAMYNNDFEILDYFKLGASVISVALNESDVIVSGSYRGVADFDLEDDNSEIFESQSNFGNGFIASYSLDGTFNWVNTFTSDVTGNRGLFCSLIDDKIFLINR